MSVGKPQIPNRFEALQNMTRQVEELSTIVRPVYAALKAIDEIHDDMASAGQGAFLVLHGQPGSGKSTFVHTLKLFREGVRTLSVDPEQPIAEALEGLIETTELLRVVVLAGREAPASVSDHELEVALHSINQFIRSTEGRATLVVWPCTSEEAARRILSKAALVGGDALTGVFPDGLHFLGPPKGEYVEIARGTVQALNGGTTLLGLGITDERAAKLASEASTIGAFLASLRAEERRCRTALVNLLPEKDRHNLWVVVIAGNDPETEVGTLTSGAHFSADIERLLASTEANVVQDLKRYPEKLGLLGRSFDARILQLPFQSALSVVRDLAGDELRATLEASGLSMKKAGDGLERLKKSQLARAFQRQPVALRSPGQKPGKDRQEEFSRLTLAALKDDGALNRLLAEALKEAGLIESFKVEAPIRATQSRSTDILCKTEDSSVRLEFMWRAQANVSEIAKYVLEKLYHYGRAIGFLNGH